MTEADTKYKLVERLNDVWSILDADGDKYGVCDAIADVAEELNKLLDTRERDGV